MPKCAFCHCPLETTQGNLIPGEAMRQALTQGYSPEMSPSWETMKETAAQAVTDYEADCSDAALVESWKRQLILPNRRFRICNHCFSTLFPYLPKNPGAMPRTAPQGFDTMPQYNESDDATLGLLVPINTSIWAIFASYAALFSLVIFPAPIALILGIIALADVRKHPGLKGKGRAIFAIIMGAIFTLLLLAFFLLGLVVTLWG